MNINEFKNCEFFDWDLNDFTNEQPHHFVLKEKTYNATTWVELIDCLCEILEKEDQGLMNSFLEDEKTARTRIPYISDNPEDIHFKKLIKKSGLWLNYKIDAPRSAKLIRYLLDKYKIDERHFKLFLQIKGE